jgi:sugar/nucleoside kinase (ribokinase family)
MTKRDSKSAVPPAPKVVGVGLIALDVVVNDDPLSPTHTWSGGTCGNVLSILAFHGWSSFPVARLNGDAASKRVKTDLKKWGVHLDFASCAPTAPAPIIVQENRRARDGSPTHRFSWQCPHCGHWLPGFKPVTRAAVEAVSAGLPGTSVYFMDRVSRATLSLASEASDLGAVVVFEPSGRSDPKLFAEAIAIAHVVKYADRRLADAGITMGSARATQVEIQTLGATGLRYRHRLGKKSSQWHHLPAVPAPRVVDTCGSGDWCTAGFLEKVARGGQGSLLDANAPELRDALRYGQALAAWNCGFEGARGGMYEVSKPAFRAQVAGVVNGKPVLASRRTSQKHTSMVPCPACASV